VNFELNVFNHFLLPSIQMKSGSTLQSELHPSPLYDKINAVKIMYV